MYIKITVLKQAVLTAYKNTMSEYDKEERDRYMSNAKEDIGGWLGDYILFLVGVTASGARLSGVTENQGLLHINYEYPHEF